MHKYTPTSLKQTYVQSKYSLTLENMYGRVYVYISMHMYILKLKKTKFIHVKK